MLYTEFRKRSASNNVGIHFCEINAHLFTQVKLIMKIANNILIFEHLIFTTFILSQVLAHLQ